MGVAKERGAESLDQARPDVAALMAEIRERVKADVAANRDKPKPFKATAADPSRECRAGEILHSEELRYLNTHYAYGPSLNLEAISSHRFGIIGKLIVRAKRKLLTIIWDLLKDYFSAEREYQANLVRLLNNLSRYMDARDAAIFWELIRKIDVDTSRAMERIERIGDEQLAALRGTEHELYEALGALRTAQQQAQQAGQNQALSQAERLKTLEGVSAGLERLVALLHPAPTTAAVPGAPSDLDPSYLLLENRFRGSEEEIAASLELYPPLFAGTQAPVLDIGAGRGELLALFRRAAIPAYGVDIDAAMVASAAEKGLEVFQEDALEHLRQRPDQSLGGVIAIQVVEHLNQGQLKELFQLCRRKLVPGGRVAFETINPCSLVALSSNFFRDPSHVFPLHPDTLAFALSLAGFAAVTTQEVAPFPAAAQLSPLPTAAYMTPDWAHTVALLNQNLAKLNGLLYGSQSYYVTAVVSE